MGTNYYAVRRRPTVESPIHIGKSSFGWRFLFQIQNDMWRNPPVEWRTYNQLVEWLEKYVESGKEYVILDEYDKEHTLEEFTAMVAEKQKEHNADDFTYCQNIDGYRFIDGDFW